MSVVNRMLKDLDKRQQQHAFPPVAQANIPAARGRSGWRWLAIGILLGALLFAVGWWLLSQANTSSASLPALVTIDATAPNTQPTPPAAAKSPAPEPVVAASEKNDTHVDVAAAQNAAPAASIAPADATVTTATDDTTTVAATAAPADEPPVSVKAAQPSTVAASAAVLTTAEPLTAKSSAEATSAANNANGANAPSAAVAQPVEIATDAPTPAAKTRRQAQQLQITAVELTPAQLAQKQLQQAKTALDQGDNAEAIGLLRQALQHDAGLHEARRQLAALYFAAGNLSDAEAILQLGVQRFPAHEEFWLLLARVQLAGSQWTAADGSLSHISDTSTLAPEKWLAKIQIAQQAQQWPAVQQGYEQLIRIAPSNSRWHFGLAHALDVQGQYAAAVSEYQQALNLTGLSVDARAYIEKRLVQIGDLR
ncbi:tetratricopeptide repeat protein [Shewanella sp.]|uniref:tetratricopeptide repeat protein n=1 Tax=Shewanella sp. TaxID=50422 RepID=UPI003A96ABB2